MTEISPKMVNGEPICPGMGCYRCPECEYWVADGAGRPCVPALRKQRDDAEARVRELEAELAKEVKMRDYWREQAKEMRFHQGEAEQAKAAFAEQHEELRELEARLARIPSLIRFSLVKSGKPYVMRSSRNGSWIDRDQLIAVINGTPDPWEDVPTGEEKPVIEEKPGQ